MKNISFIIVSLLWTCSVFAQLTADRQVISNAGLTLSSGSLSHEFTVGESVIGAANSDEFLATQGFHQGNAGPASSLDHLLKEGTLVLYPQPAEEVLFIRLNSPYPTPLQVNLYDLLGRKMTLNNAELSAQQAEVQFNLSQWSEGTYFLRVTDDNGNLVHRQKWVKR